MLSFLKKISIIRLLFIFLLFILYFCICAFSYANAISSQLEDHVFRLHVIANSDSFEDQALKYKVRDALISYMNSLCQNIVSNFSNRPL